MVFVKLCKFYQPIQIYTSFIKMGKSMQSVYNLCKSMHCGFNPVLEEVMIFADQSQNIFG